MMKKLLAIVVLGLLWSSNVFAEKIEDLYLVCKDNITTVNKGTFNKGLRGYTYFNFKRNKAVDFTRYNDPFMNIKKFKIMKQTGIGEKKYKFGSWLKLKWNLNPKNLMDIKRISLEGTETTSSKVIIINISMNKLDKKKWDYTYSYFWKDIDGEDNFIVVDYCEEMTKKELNAFAKKKIF
tara:strand:+ start:55 stop:594 length:540 start_codon:yes stop_codon:yes gene_type:complete